MKKIENNLVHRNDDYSLLVSYLNNARRQSTFDRQNAEELSAELKKATVVSKNDFPQDVLQLQTYFSKENSSARVRAIPGEGADIPIWILGSSTDSAHLAAGLGLPYAFASHFAPAQFNAAITIYRQNFKPSAHLKEPYVMACVNVIAADTDSEANKLATSLFQMFKGIATGDRRYLQPPVEKMEAWTEYEEAVVNQMLSLSFIGGPETIKRNFQQFLNDTQIDEVMISTNIYDHKAKLHSYKVFAEVLKNN